jgi:cell division protease FtsH
MFLPEEDRYSFSRQSILSQICSLYGGRIAEEMTLGKEGVTTGASNDIQRATEMARNMVTKWGLSDELGPLLYTEDEGEVFLGRSAASQNKSFSGETAKAIDREVRRIIDECYGKAERILEENRHLLEVMKDALMEYETIDSDQIDDIMLGKTPRPPMGWTDSDNDGSGASSVEEGVKKEGKKEGKSGSQSGPIGGPAGEH